MAIKKSKKVLEAEALVEKEKQETLEAEMALAKEKEKEKEKAKVPELSERRKFSNWYRDVYLKDADMNELHHSDKHGQLGYETNSFMNEIHTVTGKIELVKCFGLCPKCTITLPSAKEEYENR